MGPAESFPGCAAEPAPGFWEAVFNAVPDLVTVIDRDYRILHANRALAERLGTTPESLVGRLCFEIFHCTRAPVAECPHKRLLQDGREHVAEVVEERLGGHFLVSVTPLCDRDGEVRGALHVAREFTAAEEAAASAARDHELLQSLIALHEGSDHLALAELSSFALGEMARLTGSSAGYLYSLDEPSGLLTRLAWHDAAAGADGKARPPATCSLSDGEFWGEAGRRREAIFTEGVTGVPAPFHRHLGVPLLVEGRLVAVVGLGGKRTPYGPADETLLALFARGFWEIVDRKRREEEALGHQRSLQWLLRRLEVVEEAERRKIAADLHDTIVQDLVAVRLLVAGLQDGERVAARSRRLAQAVEALDGAIGSTRTLTYELSSPLLHEFGVEAALPWLAEQTGRRFGVRVRCVVPAERLPIPAERGVLLHRIAQELLRNVAKHSGAHTATISLSAAPEAVLLVVEDDGRGFDDSGPRSGAVEEGGFGLFSIRERLRDIGGTIRIETGRTRGARVVVSIPGRAGAGSGAGI